MITRSQVRLDYKQLHTTGVRVPKMEIEAGMADLNKLKLDEEVIVEDINHTLTLYALNDLTTESEVQEAVSMVSELSSKYRRLHVEMKNADKENYAGAFPNYQDVLNKLNDYIKSSRSRVREVRKDGSIPKEVSSSKNGSNPVDSGDDAKEYSEKSDVNPYKIRLDILTSRVEFENDSVDLFTATNESEITKYVLLMEQYVEKFFDLCTDMMQKCPVAFKKDYERKILKYTLEIRHDIKLAKILRHELRKTRDKLAERRIFEKNQMHHVTKAENLIAELQIRFKSISKKYSVSLSDLSDYQILDIQQDKSTDQEFNDILEKVTELASIAPLAGERIVGLVCKISRTRDKLVSKRERFSDELTKIIIDRDITLEKMKQASDIPIEIPKFTGYDCKMDFFTFRTKYQKYIEPKIRKHQYADYLKSNYLDGAALNLVEKETDYEKIWTRLKESFGNTRFLLQNKMSTLDKFANLHNHKNDQKLANLLTKIINTMKDLSDLAREHNLEGQLYEGGGLEKVLTLIGDARHKKFRSQNLTVDFSKKQEWQKLSEFLGTELLLVKKLLLDRKSAELLGMTSGKNQSDKKPENKNPGLPVLNNNSGPKKACHICGKDDHTTIITARGNVIVPYYVCEKFVKWSIPERLAALVANNLCTICLFPGAVAGPQHKCSYTNFCCPSHDKSDKIHVLLCEKHKGEQENLKMLQRFKLRFVQKCPVPLPDFVRSLSLFSGTTGCQDSANAAVTFGFPKEIPDVENRAIFLRQKITIGGRTFNALFDNACGKLVAKDSAVEALKAMGRAKQHIEGPMDLYGVGGKLTVAEKGEFTLCLPLASGEDAQLSGLCLPTLTTEFPRYELREVEEDIRKRSFELGGNDLVSKLPKLPDVIDGGDVDILIGCRYLRYFPKSVHRFDTGLEILESLFTSSDGTRGVLNGPHEYFEREGGNALLGAMAYYTPELRQLCMAERDLPLLGEKQAVSPSDLEPNSDELSIPCTGCSCSSGCEKFIVCAARRRPENYKRFEAIESAGSEITFRCVDCRSCKKCKQGPRLEEMSIEEEYEQNLVEQCVNTDIELAKTVAKLPFIRDPITHLEPSNEHVALRVFRSQVKILNANEEDKRSVLEFEGKLQDAGYVDYFKNLSSSERALISDAPVKYFIPWRPVWKSDSVSTPCRLAFDATMSTKGACSLNSLLAKGASSLNNLQSILIRWSSYPHAFHTDVQKMYNRVLLDQAHWCYQMYLFSENLDVNDHPEWKVIKTLIYGVRPSGNLAECALRRTVELTKEEFPLAYRPITFDTYMDDCASGTENEESSRRVMDQIQLSGAKGGFSFKGCSFSGSLPPANMSQDGESVSVLGYKWFPKGDFLKLNIGELNLAKKRRGRKSSSGNGILPEKLTLTNCVGRAGEIFDPMGLAAPIVAGLKVDISTLHKQCIGWGDPIPSEMKEIWVANFQLIEDLADVVFNRAVVPSDAQSLEMETIDMGDGGENLVCAAVYARFLRRDGSYSCQLIFARTKVVHDHTTPRAELAAAVLNASTGHIVRTSIGDRHKRSWHVTDSQVALYILNTFKGALKVWSRNRVVEVSRLTDLANWFHTSRDNMTADVGTRRGATIEQIGPESPWIKGKPWMQGSPDQFPFSTVEEIKLSSSEKGEVKKEKVIENDVNIAHIGVTHVPKEVEPRYKFSNYLVNPNRFKFSTVVRIVGLVLLFLHNCAKKAKNIKRKFSIFHVDDTRKSGQYIVFPCLATLANRVVSVAVVRLPENFLTAAKNYFFRKATREVQQFVDPKRYKNISVSKNGILYYSGRILMTQKIDGDFNFSDAMLDLSESTFCVPLTDVHSPIAYAIVSETHWYDPDIKHKGVETTLRFAQTTAYIIGGRDLVKRIKNGCAKCRILHLKGVEVAMGPVADENLKIAPAFFVSQVDICGPFSAYSPANKRAKLKIWIVVFVCTVTSAVDCRIMENYDTDSFILAFTRFSCRFGYPKTLMPDEGSQLMRGCKDMVLSFSDISHKLTTEHGVDFRTCPVGAHYVHGKVERKIQHVKESLVRSMSNERISILQWETVAQQISNSINNLPIGLGNKIDSLEHLDVLTPNRLLLGRNNSRNPNEPLAISGDFRKIIESNARIFESWFREWLISHVPSLVQQPKWFSSERSVTVGDVVIFRKSEKEFDKSYQYGIVSKTFEGRDGLVRAVEVQYQNHNESAKRTTKRGVREITVVHPVDEIGISAELNNFAEAAKDIL